MAPNSEKIRTPEALTISLGGKKFYHKKCTGPIWSSPVQGESSATRSSLKMILLLLPVFFLQSYYLTTETKGKGEHTEH